MVTLLVDEPLWRQPRSGWRSSRSAFTRLHSDVEARVDLGGAGEQYVLAEAAGENIDVGEVPCGSPVEQGEELVARELFRSQRRPGRGRGGGEIWRRVHGQVDQDPAVSAADDHPAERVTIVDPLGSPASLAGRGLQGIACGGNMAALGGGEEVEVLGGPCREA